MMEGRGLTSLGLVTPDEFTLKVGRRWPEVLRRVELTIAREEVLYAIQPGIIAASGWIVVAR